MIMLNTLTPGAHFFYGDVEWIVLEHLNDGSNSTLCLTASIIAHRTFDANNGHNNFKTSSLRAYLNGTYLNSLVIGGANRSAFLRHSLDLTSDDGLRNHGIDSVQIGLLNCDQYRKYRELLPIIISHYWWTCTPETIDSNNLIRYVCPEGGLGYGSVGYNRCVRPTCALRSDIWVDEAQ